MSEQEPEEVELDADGQPIEEAPPPPVPTGAQLSALDRVFRGSPYGVVAEMREREPVHHDVEFNRYFLSRHDDVRAMLLDDALWTDPGKANPETYAHRRVNLDRRTGAAFHGRRGARAPAQSRWRGADPGGGGRVSRRASRRSSAGFWTNSKRPSSKSKSSGRYAALVATIATAEFIGVDPKLHRQIKRWCDASFTAFANPFRTEDEALAAAAAETEINALLRAAVAERRATPKPRRHRHARSGPKSTVRSTMRRSSPCATNCCSPAVSR